MIKEKVRMNNGITYDIDSIESRGHLLIITFSDADVMALTEDLSIFNRIELLTKSGIVSSVFEGYNTVYDIQINVLTLSDNNTVFNGGNINVLYPELTLPDAKNIKIVELRNICENTIKFGVNVQNKHYGYDIEDQTNIKDAFDLANRTGMSVPYHADNEPCRLYTPEEITEIFITNKMNLMHHTTYFNQLKAYVNSLDDIGKIIEVQYGDELTGEYLASYVAMMSQAELVIDALIGGNANDN